MSCRRLSTCVLTRGVRVQSPVRRRRRQGKRKITQQESVKNWCRQTWNGLHFSTFPSMPFKMHTRIEDLKEDSWHSADLPFPFQLFWLSFALSEHLPPSHKWGGPGCDGFPCLSCKSWLTRIELPLVSGFAGTAFLWRERYIYINFIF